MSRTVLLAGRDVRLSGELPEIGQKIPDVELIGNNLKPRQISEFRGQVLIIASILSVDTSVCDTEIRRFNELATEIGDDLQVVTVSVDLPFTQKRWCGAAGIERVLTLSDHMSMAFGKAFGVAIEETRSLARAIYVVDQEGVLRYREVVPEIGSQPDFDAALAAARELM